MGDFQKKKEGGAGQEQKDCDDTPKSAKSAKSVASGNGIKKCYEYSLYEYRVLSV